MPRYQRSGSTQQFPRFLQDALKHDINTREDERKLASRARRAPKASRNLKEANAARKRRPREFAARDELVTTNLRFLLSQAIKHSRATGVDLDDAFQESVIGHLEAISRFKISAGTRLSTYSSWWIRHAILRYGQDHGRDVRIPVNTLEAARKLSRAAQRFESIYGRMPDDDELAECSGVARDRIAKVRVAVQEAASLDELHGDAEGNSRTLQDLIPDPRPGADVNASKASDAAALGKAMEQLTAFETDVLRCRFEDGLTLTETANVLADRTRHGEALSRERIRQIQEHALSKLRDELVDADPR
ncbi:MAG TPA: sigma-70 family RNA polymerase sigma factor [Candidatus Eisenbacteria bacterium]|jgi:RNA polymerase primary sigma factor|nr:sigma-70 family RNA polymerase sigma factor [Candidatus Eisenbacteria bacterium]